MAKTVVTNTVIKVNDKEVSQSFNKMRSDVTKLERELKKLPVGTKEFIDKAAQLKEARTQFEAVKNEIKSVNQSLEESEGFWAKLGTQVFKFGNIINGVLLTNVISSAFDGLNGKISATVDELLKVADAMSDVQKTSGMSLEQVKKLWDEFGEMDTRTSKMDRLKIAEVGGRLGVPIEEMKSFVQEVDKAYVALGDSFEGGLEGVVDQLGKIKGLFTDTKGMTYAESINRVGSALNTLAAQGTASEGNISQFALRIGALPDALKPAIDKVLGLGAAFEESGIDYQIASSGFSNFISTAASNIEAFASSMNIGVKEAKELINTKPEEFFLKFAEGMKGVSADQTAKIFESLKLNSLEVQKAVGAAANRTDEFRNSMKTAGVEMEKMNSLQEEFNVKNNNAPAIIEKLKNIWNDLFTSTNIINRFEWLIQLIGGIVGVTNTAGNGVLAFKERMSFLWQIIKVVGTALLGYNASVLIATISTGSLTKATWLKTLADKADAAFMLIKRVALLAYNVVLGIVTLNLQRVTAATVAFNATAKANPWGVIITLILTAVVAYKSFSKEIDESVKKQKLLNDVTNEANKGISSQKSELETLLRVAKDETASKEARLTAIKRLNAISPEYLGFLNLENINTQKATDAVNAYTDALYKSSRARVLQKKMDAAVEKLEDQKQGSLNDVVGKDWLYKVSGGVMTLTPSEVKNMDKNMFKQFDKWKAKGGEAYAKQMMKNYSSYYEEYNGKLQKTTEEVNMYQDELVQLMKSDPLTVNNQGNTPTNTIAGGSGTKTPKNKPAKTEKDDTKQLQKQAHDEALASQKKQDEEEMALYYQKWQTRIDKMQDSLKREEELLLIARDKEKTAMATENAGLENDIAELEKKKAKAKFKIEIEELQKAIDAKKNIQFINNESDLIDERTYQYKLAKLREDWQLKDLEKSAEIEAKRLAQERGKREEEIVNIPSLEEAKAQLKAQSDLKLTAQELRAIDNLEDAKKALREAADRAYLKAQEKAIQTQIEMLTATLQDPSLSEEAKKKLAENLDFLKEKIIQVKSAIKGGEENDQKKVDGEKKDAKSKVDILGFSYKDWEETFKNVDGLSSGLKAAGMVMVALGNAGQQFAKIQRGINEKELREFTALQEKKKIHLLKDLNEGRISREEYNKQIAQSDKDLANKKAELEYKQAKADKVARIFGAVGNVAMGISSALAAPFPMNIVLPAIIGAMGAVQIATIMSQPLPEKPSYAEGGFTGLGFGNKDETGFKPAGIVHEGEWVAPKWMTENSRTANVIGYLESVRTGRTKPMAEGGFANNTVQNTTQNPTQNTVQNPVMVDNTAVLNELKNWLQKLYEDGVIAVVGDDAKNARKLNKMIKDYQNLENKNKR